MLSVKGFTKCSTLSHMPWQKLENIMVFIAFQRCKCWFIILFIIPTDVFKDFAVDFCLGEIFHVTSDSLEKDLKHYITFLDAFLEPSFHIEVMIDGFYLSD